jgi:hypothetical protein
MKGPALRRSGPGGANDASVPGTRPVPVPAGTTMTARAELGSSHWLAIGGIRVAQGVGTDDAWTRSLLRQGELRGHAIEPSRVGCRRGPIRR